MTYSEGVENSPSITNSDLLLGLDELEPQARSLLEIAALMGGPCSLRRLLEIGRQVPSQGAELTPAEAGRQISKLIEARLLSEAGDDILCPPEVAEPVSALCLNAKRTLAVVAQILRREPWKRAMQRDPVALFRHFRLYLYSVDYQQANGLATSLFQENGQRAWSEVGRHFLEANNFLVFPPPIALELARETLVQSLNHAFPAAPAIEALGQMLDRALLGDKDRKLYAHALLMRQDLEAFDRYLEGYEAPALEGCHKILQGDLAGIEDLERSLRESRSFFSYTALFLYLIAIMSQEGLDSPRAAKEATRSHIFRAPLEWLIAVKTGRTSELSPAMRGLLAEPPEALVPHLCLILFWAGFRFEGLDTDRLATAYAQAGYPIFADWVYWCGHGNLPSERPQPPLFALLHPGEQWRKSLEAIDAWAAPERQGPEVGQRIVWTVEADASQCQVVARIQKKTRGGGWSSGRQVHLAELSEHPPACADVHDRRVLDSLDRWDRSHQYYGSLREQEMMDAALLMLVGHPRVALSSDPEEPVEVVLEPVSVQVLRSPDYFELRLDPTPSLRPEVIALPPEAGRLRMVRISERHVQLGKLLGSGLRIPLQAEHELKETVTRLTSAGLLARSDIMLNDEVDEQPSDSRLVIRLAPYAEGLAVQVRVTPLGPDGPAYEPGLGAPVVAGKVNGLNCQTRRDSVLETTHLNSLRDRLPLFADLDFVRVTAREALELLEGLSQAQDETFRCEWPEGEKLRLTTVQPSQMSQSLRSGTDWFSLRGELRVDEDLVLNLAQLLQLRSEHESRFLPLSQGKYLALTTEFEAYLARLERLAQRSSGGALMLHPLAAMSVVPDEEQVEVDEGWRELKARMAEGESACHAELPSEFRAQLRDYQDEGVRWLLGLAHWGAGACLADDMGLGKTIQLLCLLVARADQGPALVVAPTSVCWNWMEEAARFAPSLRMLSLADSPRRAAMEELGAGDVLVCSYGLLVNESTTLAEVSWATVVLDEAQAIKNPATQRARAAYALKSRFRVAATGTPVENRPEELWALFRFLNPGLLGARKTFGRRLAASSAGQELLSQLISPFILRRTKQQVLTELPPRTEVLERVALSPEERALYESMRRQAVDSLKGSSDDYVSVLAQLTRLRRACCHPSLVLAGSKIPSSKVERFLELVEELLDNGHRALVFSQFVAYLEILREALEAREISYQYLDGSTPAALRRKAVRAFQDGQGELFLISLKAGGTGLNLTAADYVIHMDPWWNPAVEDQASDRAHRMGQQRPVTVYRLVAQGTVEEQIVELHEQKRDLAQRLLDGAEAGQRLGTADLLALLGG